MSRNALLEAPIGNDRTPAGGYHSPMGDQFRQAPTPHQWHQPPYPPAPAPAAGRRWMPVAVISAAIIIAAALVGGAVIMSKSNKADTSAAGGGQASLATAESSTCQAWSSTRAALGQIPFLPRGWDWNTPNIDTLIANKNSATHAVLEQFTPKIAAEPADVAEAANSYVAAKRREIALLADHTYTPADGTAGNEALARLNQLCGIAD